MNFHTDHDDIINFFKNFDIDIESFILCMIPIYKFAINNQSDKNISDNIVIKAIQDVPDIIMSKFSEHIQNEFNNKFKIPSVKGKITEDFFYKELVNIFPNCDIELTRSQSYMGDFIIKSDDNPDILIDIKNYSSNVNKKEIEKFKRDCSTNFSCGILISTNGICGKQNFSIDLDEKRILMYIHKFNFDKEIILTAVNIIYYLYDILLTNMNLQSITHISNKEFEKIKKQYNLFLKNKEESLINLKQFYIKQVKLLKAMNLNVMEGILIKKII